MIKLVILFKTSTQSADFERRYEGNLALLRRMPGLQRIQRGLVQGSPGGAPSIQRITEVYFESFNALDAALTSPEGVAAGKDLMDFAGKQVELLFVEEQSAQAKPLTPKNLQAYLDEFDIEAEIVSPNIPTPTVPVAAKALGVDEEQIVKSVVFLVNERPFIVYANGTQRVDPRKLASRLDVNRKQVKLADADQVLDLTGYAVGTVPPVGLKTRLPAFLDSAIQQHEIVYAGGGGISALLKITPEELLRATNAEVVPLLREDPVESDDLEAESTSES